MNVGPAVSSRLALQRFFARTDFVTSKTSISRRSGPGSVAPFKGSRPDRLVFMLSALSTSQAAKRGAHGNNISLVRDIVKVPGNECSLFSLYRESSSLASTKLCKEQTIVFGKSELVVLRRSAALSLRSRVDR